MRIDCRQAHFKLIGDFAARKPVGHPEQDFAFAIGQQPQSFTRFSNFFLKLG